MTIKKITHLGIGAILIAIASSWFIVMGISLYKGIPRTCLSGKMFLNREGNWIDLGEMEFCGSNLSVSGLYGPSLEHHLFIIKKQNAELKEALYECRTKIQL